MLAAACALFVALMLMPAIALADYSIDRVSIDADVAADGSVRVQERRTFSFDDDYNGVYWKIPTGSAADGRTVSATIESVGVVDDGASDGSVDASARQASADGAGLEAFTQADVASNGADGVFTTSDEGSSIQVKLYHPISAGETVTFQIAYVDSGLAVRHEDVGELYWKFVSDGWDVESQDVSCVVHLPVPPGAQIVHDGSDAANVRAWGHGPLDATVSIADDGTVTYEVPGVGSDEYAEARIAFPAEWLSGARSDGEEALPAILSEEQEWTDQANASRRRARMLLVLAIGAPLALAAATCIVAALLLRRYRATHAPSFDDAYFRDVPSDDHPAVLGALLRGGEPGQDDLAASIMRLTDEGLAHLEKASWQERGAFGRMKEREGYRLDRSASQPSPDAAGKLDAKTLGFLFDGVAPLAPSDGVRPQAEGGRITLWFSDIPEVARAHPQRYADLYEDWSDEVAAACIQRRFFVDDHPVATWPLALLASIDVVACMAGFVALGLAGAGGPWALALIAALAISLLVVHRARSQMKELSSEAIEILAKMKALKRWLKEFTRLKEAVPTDVALWDRLLVMAVVLGVSKEVVEQLEVAAPQVLEDPAIRPLYGWYWLSGPMGSPFDSLGSIASEVHKVSAAAAAASQASSAGGAGGGFSGGGGGGFGGGGGGGAF